MLMPAAVLILVILGAIAVDFAVVFLAQRELSSATAAAANDAAGAAISDSSFYEGGGQIVIDRLEAERVAREALRLRMPEDGQVGAIRLVEDAEVQVAGRQVCVSARATVRYVFARAIPGVRHETELRARSTASAVGDDGRTVPTRTIC